MIGGEKIEARETSPDMALSPLPRLHRMTESISATSQFLLEGSVRILIPAWPCLASFPRITGIRCSWIRFQNEVAIQFLNVLVNQIELLLYSLVTELLNLVRVKT